MAESPPAPDQQAEQATIDASGNKWVNGILTFSKELKKVKVFCCDTYQLHYYAPKSLTEKKERAVQGTPVGLLGGEDRWRRDRLPTPVFLGFPCGSAVKNPPAMQETWVRSLGWEDPLEKGEATHSSILA